MSKLGFVVGIGVGYVLGTRAGRDQYDKLLAHARDLLDDPTVREVTDTAKAGARRLLAEGHTVVSDTTSKVTDQLAAPKPTGTTSTP